MTLLMALTPILFIISGLVLTILNAVWFDRTLDFIFTYAKGEVVDVPMWFSFFFGFIFNGVAFFINLFVELFRHFVA
jgi:hypothetical protein